MKDSLLLPVFTVVTAVNWRSGQSFGPNSGRVATLSCISPVFSHADYLSTKMVEALWCFETSVHIYRTIWCPSKKTTPVAVIDVKTSSLTGW